VDLGTLYSQFAGRQPDKAEDWIAKAIAAYDRARKIAGDSCALTLKVGDAKVQLCEVKEEQLQRNPKDHRLKRDLTKGWEDALDVFKDALELDEKNPQVTTAYNECLWNVLKAKKGRYRDKPILKEYQSRYHKITFLLPNSTWWKVRDNQELDDKDTVFQAIKYNPKAEQGLFIQVYQWRWDTNYTNEETNETVGGDNIGGLAKMSEKDLRAYFKDIKEREPLRKQRLGRHISKAEGFTVKGMSGSGFLCEWKTWFFKNSKSQKTYQLTVIANLGMLDRNPYELETVLDNIRTSD
jgi:hypothetical protein